MLRPLKRNIFNDFLNERITYAFQQKIKDKKMFHVHEKNQFKSNLSNKIDLYVVIDPNNSVLFHQMWFHIKRTDTPNLECNLEKKFKVMELRVWSVMQRSDSRWWKIFFFLIDINET